MTTCPTCGQPTDDNHADGFVRFISINGRKQMLMDGTVIKTRLQIIENGKTIDAYIEPVPVVCVVDREQECQHDWKEVYYGIKCQKCGLFYPDNGNYFAPDGDDDDEVQDGICEGCGGEYGDGWSNCTCDTDDDNDEREDEIQ